MNKDKLAKDFKLYNVIVNNFWKLIVTVIIGFLLGYLTTHKSEAGNNYMVLCVVVFLAIGIINFFIGIIKEHHKLVKRDEMRKRLEEQQMSKDEDNEKNK